MGKGELQGLEEIPATRQGCWEALQGKDTENGPEEEGGGGITSCVFLDFLPLCVDFQCSNLRSLPCHAHPPPTGAQCGQTCAEPG